jgi:hypothetical protein
MDHRDSISSATEGADLKSRIFAAFEHACRYGEVEVADRLLAIINSKWIKRTRSRQPGITATRHSTAAGHG